MRPGPSPHRCPKPRRPPTTSSTTRVFRPRSARKSSDATNDRDLKFQSLRFRMSTAAKKEHKSNRPERGGVVTFVEAIRQGIWEEMERDPSVFLIGEDVGTYGGAFKVTDGILDEFGEGRVIDTPISEAAIVGAACGAALMGMRPVAEFQFIDFITPAFD